MKLHSDLCLESDSHIIDNVKVVLRRLNSVRLFSLHFHFILFSELKSRLNLVFNDFII